MAKTTPFLLYPLHNCCVNCLSVVSGKNYTVVLSYPLRNCCVNCLSVVSGKNYTVCLTVFRLETKLLSVCRQWQKLHRLSVVSGKNCTVCLTVFSRQKRIWRPEVQFFVSSIFFFLLFPSLTVFRRESLTIGNLCQREFVQGVFWFIRREKTRKQWRSTLFLLYFRQYQADCCRWRWFRKLMTLTIQQNRC